jgi:DNA-binding MurR/RpiR family transcriptional regulator
MRYDMATTSDLISKINEKYGKMSKGQKLLANYIIDNYDKAVFLTAAKLGEMLGVSESTVVRFASFIGYKGYPEFQQALEALVRAKLNASDRIEITSGGIEQNGVLRTVLSSDALKIKNTMETIDEAAFENAVESILNARRIYVVGIRTCAPLASFLSFYLNMIFDNVVNLQTSSTSELFEQMIHINEKDCIIGISFPRYSMRTLKALEFANNRRADVITITDSIHSPMNLYSSCNLIAESDMHAAVDSLVAPLSVINALLVALCNKKQAQVAKNLEMIEEVWNNYQFYENDEIDMVDDSIKMYYPGEI